MANRYSIETTFEAIDRMTGPISRMQKRVRDFTDSMSGGAKRAANFMSGIATKSMAAGSIVAGAFTTAAAGVALFVTSTNDANEEIIRMSNAMGVQYDTTKAMDGILSSMTLTWENFTDLIEEQSNKFGELKGTDEMKNLEEAIALTGLSMKDLKKMNPEQQFVAIADSLTKMADSQKAAFIADEIWGGEGNKIIQGLRSRKMSMSDVIDQYQKYNFYTKEAQNATLEYNKALTPLKQTVGTMKSQFAALIGQALTPYIGKAMEWIAANKQLIQTKIAEYAQKIADSIAWLATNMGTLITWVQRFGIAIGIFITLTAVLRTFVLVMTVVNILMMMNPIGLIILGVVALIALIGYLINKFFGWEAVLKTVEVVMYAVIGGVLAMMGPVGWLIMAAILIYKNWGVISGFFSSLWSGVVDIFNSAAASIMSVIDRIVGGITKVINLGSRVGSFLGFGNGGDAAANGAAVVSPQARTAANLNESRSSAEVTITDQTGRAKVTKGKLGDGVRLQRSGAM